MSKSAYGIVLSNYMRELIPGTNVLYHGSEPYFKTDLTSIEAKRKCIFQRKERLH